MVDNNNNSSAWVIVINNWTEEFLSHIFMNTIRKIELGTFVSSAKYYNGCRIFYVYFTYYVNSMNVCIFKFANSHNLNTLKIPLSRRFCLSSGYHKYNEDICRK